MPDLMMKIHLQKRREVGLGQRSVPSVLSMKTEALSLVPNAPRLVATRAMLDGDTGAPEHCPCRVRRSTFVGPKTQLADGTPIGAAKVRGSHSNPFDSIAKLFAHRLCADAQISRRAPSPSNCPPKLNLLKLLEEEDIHGPIDSPQSSRAACSRTPNAPKRRPSYLEPAQAGKRPCFDLDADAGSQATWLESRRGKAAERTHPQ